MIEKKNEKECTCHVEAGFHISCDLHVACDDDCRALKHPITIEEYEKTLNHWVLHSVFSGCSHGC